MKNRKKSIANPFSTGGGGTSFELSVGATYLVSLLAGDSPRGLDWGTTIEVKFQQKWSGCDLDDIVVIASDGATKRKLALQIKHTLTFSESNETFIEVLNDCWNTFNSFSGWPFDKDIDKIGIGLGIYNTKLDKHFGPVLEIVRKSKDSEDFFQKTEIPEFFSAEKKTT